MQENVSQIPPFIRASPPIPFTFRTGIRNFGRAGRLPKVQAFLSLAVGQTSAKQSPTAMVLLFRASLDALEEATDVSRLEFPALNLTQAVACPAFLWGIALLGARRECSPD